MIATNPPLGPLRPGQRIFTGRVEIGVAYVPRPAPIDSADALKLQRALLEPKTAQRPGPLAQLFGGIYKWL